MLNNNSVPNRRHLGHVVSVLAAPHQELQGSRESLDTRDHPAIVDLKDPWAQEETQVIKDLVGSKDLKEIQDSRVRRVYQDAKVNRVSQDALDLQDHPANKEIKEQGDKQETKGTKDLVERMDLKETQDPRDRRVKQEAKVNQVLVVSKVLRELLHLQLPCEVIGNSVYLRV